MIMIQIYDKTGRAIKKYDILKVFHFIGARLMFSGIDDKRSSLTALLPHSSKLYPCKEEL